MFLRENLYISLCKVCTCVQTVESVVMVVTGIIYSTRGKFESLFHIFSSGVKRNGLPSIKSSGSCKKTLGQNQLYPLQMGQIEFPRNRNPCVSSIFGGIPFLIFCPCVFLSSLSLG